MSHTPHLKQYPTATKANPDRLKTGTLSYTKFGLVTLFAWLLWGNFCFSLMGAVVPSVLPIKLNALKVPNWMIGLIMTTIPSLMNSVINPFVSFRSDRFRSRWGRRIPFLAVATPFLVLFLILLGHSEEIGVWLQGAVLGGRFSQTSVVILTIGILMVGFQFFNAIINSVYWYIFNDVVPSAFLARFMAMFRMVGGGAGATYNYFVFKYAGTHMKEIFTGAAIIYLVAFMVMCWRVKEGEYPPPPANVGGRKGLLAALKTYAVECFSHRFYWYLFLAQTCFAMTWLTGSFRVFQLRSIGIDLATMGKVGGIAGLVSLSLLYPASLLADRFHPLRVLIVASSTQVLVQSIWLIFLVFDFSHQTTLAIFIGVAVVGLPATTLYSASELPMFMKLLPRERYGQFCSACALVRSVCIIFGGLLCGGFLDAMARMYPAKDYCYRFLPLWNMTFIGSSVLFLLLLYREWKRLGGLTSYRPPSAAVEPEAG